MRLATDEMEIDAPDAAALEAALARLSGEREAYILLRPAEREFLQATRTEGSLTVERQDESVRFVLEGEPAIDAVSDLFRRCLSGDETWRTDPGWREASEEGSQREERAALLSALSAAPLKVPQSPDGSFWSSTNGDVTALLAFASEENLREACPGAGVLSLEAAQLLRLFLGGPHGQLFVESGGDWLSLDKDAARALLEAGDAQSESQR